MGRKTLVHGSIPSLFKFRKRENTSARKSPRKCICFEKNQTETDNSNSDNDINFDIDESGENFSCAQCGVNDILITKAKGPRAAF